MGNHCARGCGFALFRRCAERDDVVLSFASGTITVREYWKLTRPKIVVMVLVCNAGLGLDLRRTCRTSEPGRVGPDMDNAFNAMLGTTGVIVGAIALNQRLECQGDAKMPRTADRPLPAGRLTAGEVTRFARDHDSVGRGVFNLL